MGGESHHGHPDSSAASEIPEVALVTSTNPSPHTVPASLLAHQPSRDETHKSFHHGVVIRQVFLHQPLDEGEQEMITQFRIHCREHNFTFPPRMEPLLLRILLYNKRKHPHHYLHKSVEHTVLMRDWRREMYPVSEVEVRKDLESGVMYWVGRDASYRPLAIVRLSRLSREVRENPDRFKRLTVFVFEWALRHAFVPGKVETCKVLVDLSNVPLRSIPIKVLKDMVSTLTKQYPFRLDKMFIVNAPKIVSTLWAMIKGLLTEVQQQKINFMKDHFQEDLLKEYHPSQLEQQYGGTLPDIQPPAFYPFAFPPSPTSPIPHVPDVWRACDETTSQGVLWAGDVRTPIQWSAEAPEIFKKCGLTYPEGRPIPPEGEELIARATDLLSSRLEELLSDPAIDLQVLSLRFEQPSPAPAPATAATGDVRKVSSAPPLPPLAADEDTPEVCVHLVGEGEGEEGQGGMNGREDAAVEASPSSDRRPNSSTVATSGEEGSNSPEGTPDKKEVGKDGTGVGVGKQHPAVEVVPTKRNKCCAVCAIM
ncbi:unnamed protein product [Vitrella brassicaformis CCMP3155]|uniref:CRAL-TRIO domain-containing protein n=2 Tax=Vitrella brassicaformis TaxID=1169539 RepID=A0A0G4EH83_VITBC|nr:unnamed protein product [Vitrella brassicaformis CCMP3155]|eukprot:CEL95337.1 unnamed protein product [Vitrella brassicaformis CCMP3155]